MPRALPCNRDYLRQLRQRRDWTQADLARRAGYSERLIIKAESGSSIAVETISDLAEALSDEGEPVFWEDLASNPVQLAQRYIHTLHVHQKEAIDHLADMIDPEAVFRVAGDPRDIPFAGEHHGIDEIRRTFDLFFSVLEVPPHDFASCYQYICQGPDAVVWGDSWIHPIGRPLKEPIRVTNLLRFRRGKLIFLDDCYDTAAGAACLRNRPKA
ncbi:helix-turn-helix domain-containing protein [Blastopirellula marina]|uniref:HTH cro/C1-type domain-containing protein n=1 Tax=Blastopirellula marina TaxID=124 RepID=A0A2S8GUX8_9BACT|nr:helix-turn-helix domain-containing protein [Blastopirellula marina]PQO48212.1 hypothetical protein C5Y93_00580 [Blastopirellula marina]